MIIGARRTRAKGKDTSFPLSVTNKLRPTSEIGIPDRDGGTMGRDARITFVPAQERAAAIFPNSSKLTEAEDREKAVSEWSSVIVDNGNHSQIGPRLKILRIPFYKTTSRVRYSLRR